MIIRKDQIQISSISAEEASQTSNCVLFECLSDLSRVVSYVSGHSPELFANIRVCSVLCDQVVIPWKVTMPGVLAVSVTREMVAQSVKAKDAPMDGCFLMPLSCITDRAEDCGYGVPMRKIGMGYLVEGAKE